MPDTQPTWKQIPELARWPAIAVLATLDLDGSPNATSVWYLYDDEIFNDSRRIVRKDVKNLRRIPMGTLTIEDTTDSGSQWRSPRNREWGSGVHPYDVPMVELGGLWQDFR